MWREIEMSLAQIEAELANLTRDELRHLAVKSWQAFVHQEGRPHSANECNKEDPYLLAASDQAVAQAAAAEGYSGNDVRARLGVAAVVKPQSPRRFHKAPLRKHGAFTIAATRTRRFDNRRYGRHGATQFPLSAFSVSALI